MTPHRSHGRGTLVLDREMGPRIGRIRLASGTTDLDVFRRMNDDLSTLKETARWDLLRSLRDRVFTPLELRGAFRDSRLDQLPTSQEMLPAQAAIEAWVERADVKESQRAAYKRCLLEVLAETPDARIRDLPELLRTFRDRCQDDGRRRTFNMTRSGAQSFTRSTFGGGSKLWHAIADIDRLKETPRAGNPQTVAQVVALAKKLGVYQSELWSICLTGMRRAEYWKDGELGQGPWENQGDRLSVTGKGGKLRIVPVVLPPSAPAVGYSRFLVLLREASGKRVNVHDLRKTYDRWMQEAGIPRARRKLYLGHGKTDVTDLYELYEVSEFIAHDAEKFRAFIGDAPNQALRVMA
jgi:integrase